MDLAAQLAELISFDIVFVGLVTLLTGAIGWALWGQPFSEQFPPACIQRLKSLIPSDTLMKGGAVLLAALVGMVVNLTADEFLEKEEFVHAISAGYRKAEDLLKEKAAKDALHLVTTHEARETLISHIEQGSTRALFQHVYAATLKDAGQPVLTMLRFEFTVVRTLRVLWLNSVILLMVAILGWIRTKGRLRDTGQLTAGRRAQHGKWGLTVVILLGASQSFLWLWEEQSTRYYKKLLHSYLAVKAGSDPVLAKSLEVAEYSDLKLIPGRKTSSQFSDKSHPDGGTDMYEFSAVENIAGRVIIADNETGTLLEPREGVKDPAELALFEAKLAKSGEIKLARIWTKAFEHLGKKQYDDIEGLAFHNGALYLLGSHSKSQSGKIRTERQVVLRLGLDAKGEALGKPTVYKNLMKALVRQHAELGLDVEGRGDETVVKDINIEGLASLPGTGDLLLGLRFPSAVQVDESGLRHSFAIVLRLHDVDRLFAFPQTEPQISLFAKLDLNGKGISSLYFDVAQQAFLVGASSPSEGNSELSSSLFVWKRPFSTGENLKEVVRFQGHKLEGICRLDDGAVYPNALVLVFDEEGWSRNDKGEDVRLQFGRILILEWKVLPPA